jgi:hypothetical protein
MDNIVELTRMKLNQYQEYIMKSTRSTTKWFVAFVLFSGFIVLFFLDLTGVDLHQWLGTAGCALIFYHLVTHWGWIMAVSERFFGRTSHQARLYFLLDYALLLGFASIILSGLLISTWLNLTLINYNLVATFHETTSILTLILVVLKIALHARWIVKTARQLPQAVLGSYPVRGSAPATLSTPRTAVQNSNGGARPIIRVASQQPATQTIFSPKPLALQPVAVKNMERRDFLRLMGIVTAAAGLSIAHLVADARESNPSITSLSSFSGQESLTSSVSTSDPASSVADSLSSDQTSALNSASESSQPLQESANQLSVAAHPTEAVQPTQDTTALSVQNPLTVVESEPAQTLVCTARCRKGRSCSFPGECREYRDFNSNGRCDLGECA